MKMKDLTLKINEAITGEYDTRAAKVKAITTVLEDGVKEIAELRLANPELSIEALGKKLNPPISKSGANHRLRKIVDLAKEL